MNNHILSVAMIGKNRIGLISDLTKFIYKKGANIHKSRMIGYDSSFLISLQARTDNKLNAKIIEKEFKDEIEIFTADSVTEFTNFEKPLSISTYNASINITLSDTPGIIHKTTSILAKNNININELRSDVELSPFTNSPLFKLNINAAIPNIINLGELYTNITDNQDLVGLIEIKAEN